MVNNEKADRLRCCIGFMSRFFFILPNVVVLLENEIFLICLAVIATNHLLLPGRIATPVHSETNPLTRRDIRELTFYLTATTLLTYSAGYLMRKIVFVAYLLMLDLIPHIAIGLPSALEEKSFLALDEWFEMGSDLIEKYINQRIYLALGCLLFIVLIDFVIRLATKKRGIFFRFGAIHARDLPIRDLNRQMSAHTGLVFFAGYSHSVPITVLYLFVCLLARRPWPTPKRSIVDLIGGYGECRVDTMYISTTEHCMALIAAFSTPPLQVEPLTLLLVIGLFPVFLGIVLKFFHFGMQDSLRFSVLKVTYVRCYLLIGLLFWAGAFTHPMYSDFEHVVLHAQSILDIQIPILRNVLYIGISAYFFLIPLLDTSFFEVRVVARKAYGYILLLEKAKSFLVFFIFRLVFVVYYFSLKTGNFPDGGDISYFSIQISVLAFSVGDIISVYNFDFHKFLRDSDLKYEEANLVESLKRMKKSIIWFTIFRSITNFAFVGLIFFGARVNPNKMSEFFLVLCPLLFPVILFSSGYEVYKYYWYFDFGL